MLIWSFGLISIAHESLNSKEARNGVAVAELQRLRPAASYVFFGPRAAFAVFVFQTDEFFSFRLRLRVCARHRRNRCLGVSLYNALSVAAQPTFPISLAASRFRRRDR